MRYPIPKTRVHLKLRLLLWSVNIKWKGDSIVLLTRTYCTSHASIAVTSFRRHYCSFRDNQADMYLSSARLNHFSTSTASLNCLTPSSEQILHFTNYHYYQSLSWHHKRTYQDHLSRLDLGILDHRWLAFSKVSTSNLVAPLRLLAEIGIGHRRKVPRRPVTLLFEVLCRNVGRPPSRGPMLASMLLAIKNIAICKFFKGKFTCWSVC
jgi:hypothetical protein